MNGKFAYRKNCSLLHFIPQGERLDDFPVIVFPQRNIDAVENRLYEFQIIPTKKATYTIDGEVYRVAHAIALRDVSGKEAGILDQVIYGRDRSSSSLGDHLPADVRAKLAALASATTS